MLPQSGFEHHASVDADNLGREAEMSPVEASNDPSYRGLERLSPVELFQRRKAHEITLRLGFRDAKIDANEILMIQKEMSKQCLTEDEYTKFLETYHVAE